ncbi:hypothetical protein SAMN04489733_0967 [Amycolatopsis keratiniphila]|nr:hypothetical protein SAMN04489733_0967 [Amycolatopsis keratiniphila]
MSGVQGLPRVKDAIPKYMKAPILAPSYRKGAFTYFNRASYDQRDH